MNDFGDPLLVLMCYCTPAGSEIRTIEGNAVTTGPLISKERPPYPLDWHDSAVLPAVPPVTGVIHSKLRIAAAEEG